MRTTPGFSLTAPVTMAVVCFRHEPAGMSVAAIDVHNARIVERVNAAGTAYLTYTQLRGRTSMRVGVGNIHTTHAHLEEVWRSITTAALQLSQ